MAYKVKARIETETPVYYDDSTTYHWSIISQIGL